MRRAHPSHSSTATSPDRRAGASAASGRDARLPAGNRSRIAALGTLITGNHAALPGPDIGAADSRHEHEADRWATPSAPAPAPRGASGVPHEPLPALRPSPWRAALRSQWGSGAPLDPGIRGELEGRAGADLGQVRVHRNHAVDAASAALGARAWTLGTDIFLGADAPAPDTPAGARLLGHETAHVLQQGQDTASTSGLSAAPYQLQRQVVPTTPTPATPTFSVNQATYQGLVSTALGQMSGRLVQTETLATTVEPMLRAMAGNAVWKDAAGNTHGGGAITHTVRSTALNLTLIFNDDPDPTRPAGLFHHGSSLTDAQIEVFIHHNPTQDELAATLYHEAMHLVSWLVNRPTPALSLRGSGHAGPSGAVATLDMARAARQIASVRQWLDTLAQGVNPRRASAAQIDAANLDRMASWLVEEVSVRVETEVFRQAEETQRLMATRGPIMYVAPGPNWRIDAHMVDRYVFDFSHLFLPTDRAGLNATDRQTLATLLQILEGIYQSRLRRRFNRTPYLIGRGIPRAPMRWTPPPLTPPTFGPPPLP